MITLCFMLATISCTPYETLSVELNYVYLPNGARVPFKQVASYDLATNTLTLDPDPMFVNSFEGATK